MQSIYTAPAHVPASTDSLVTPGPILPLRARPLLVLMVPPPPPRAASATVAVADRSGRSREVSLSWTERSLHNQATRQCMHISPSPRVARALRRRGMAEGWGCAGIQPE